MSTDNFVWDDESVKHYALWYKSINSNTELLKEERFAGKKIIDIYKILINEPKQQSVCKDWEIVSLKHKYCSSVNYWHPLKGWQHEDIDFVNYEIHSVRRLSDGEVFSVGDEVENALGKYKIKGFNTLGDTMYLNNWIPNESMPIQYIKKCKPILFTTEDGKEIFEGDEYWFFYPNYEVCKSVAKKDFVPSNKTFSTEEAASEYVIRKKVLFSYSDIAEQVDYCSDSQQLLLLKLLKVAESKLKQ